MLKKVVTAEVKAENLLDSKEAAEKLVKKIAEVKAKKESKDDKEVKSKSTN